MELEDLQNGVIVRCTNNSARNKNERDWVLIHISYINSNSCIEKYRKHIKNHTGYYMMGGPWYEGNLLTNEPYGKTNGQLHRGELNQYIKVGDISKDYIKYKKDERL